MNGFITLAIGDQYLQRAAAFALSAKRFGNRTILMYDKADPDRYSGLFHRCVSIADASVVNTSRTHAIWELKKHCYLHSSEFETCAFVDADSLLIRDPSAMFKLVEQFPIHTPGARPLGAHETWAAPSSTTAREIATAVGVSRDAVLHTLNGGFLVWQRCEASQRWFDEFSRLFGKVMEVCRDRKCNPVARDELCMSLAFALEGVSLPRSDSSIGVWDAHHLKLDIASQDFSCRKGYYWENHAFSPFIAHFGGATVSALYRACVEYLQRSVEQIDLPLFQSSELQGCGGDRRHERPAFNGFSITQHDYHALIKFVRDSNIRRVLEFGPGASTWAFVEAGCEVVTLEYQPEWVEHYRKEFSSCPQVNVVSFKNSPSIKIPELKGQCFDLGFVDSPVGTLYKRNSRLNACEFVAARADRWMLHDAQRSGEKETLALFQQRGWNVQPLDGSPKTAVATQVSSTEVPVNSNGYNHSALPGSRQYDFDHWDSLPLVSCQCITYGRPHLLGEAVQSFLLQDYAGRKELVILNDHPGITIEPFDHPDIRVVNISERFRSIGEKRNACCGLCSGQVIFPWDDDDISLPSRISISLEQMKNRAYFKPDRFWYSAHHRLSIRKGVAHAMGAWSRELFDQVQGYPHIQSGQDQAIEKLFEQTGKRSVVAVDDADLFYIYRFPGTGSYHLSAFGYGKGLQESQRYVSNNVAAGSYRVTPKWNHDYVALVGDELSRHRQSVIS